MKDLLQKKTRQNTFWFMMLVFGVSFLLSMGVAVYSMIYLLDKEQEQAGQTAVSQAERIDHVVENLLYTTRTVEALLKEGQGSIHDFEQAMKDIIGNYPLRNIALAPDGIVTQVHPYAGNEASIGHDLFEDPTRSTEAVLARDSGKLTLSGPFELRQGGFSAIGRLPVYLKDKRGNPYFWGFVCVALGFPEAMHEARMEDLVNQGYAYELWRILPDSGEKQVIMCSEKPLVGEPTEQSISLPNSTWILSLTPEHGWVDWEQIAFRFFIVMAFSVLVSLLCRSVLALARSRNELNINIQQQAVNYRELSHLNEELRDFRHDNKNHMLALSSLLKRKDFDRMQEYIDSISEKLTATARIVNTENYVFDALLAEKIEKAKNKQIQIESEVLLGKQLAIRNEDWIGMFGNALDNAIEACEKVTEKAPKINLLVQHSGNILQVRISNTAQEKPVLSEKRYLTTKQDAVNHGIGLKNIEAIVKRYKGVMETSCENGVFTLSFLLFDV